MKSELLAVLKLNIPFGAQVDPVLLHLLWNLPSCDLPPMSKTTEIIDYLLL